MRKQETNSVLTALVTSAFLLTAGCPSSEREESPVAEPPAEAAQADDVEADVAEMVEPRDPMQAPDDVAAPPEDAERTESGLASKVLREGTGEEHPSATTRVRVHYTGWTTDGEMFDSSHRRGQPIDLRLNQVIPGWTEGVQLMVVGEKRRLWIPEELAYGGRPGAPQGMLVFDVELVDIP